MSKLASQKHNIKDTKDTQAAPPRRSDHWCFLCDACAHTFVASLEECRPTHAAMSFLGSRRVSSHEIARMPTKCAPRLQIKRAGDGDDGDSSFEDDGHDDFLSDVEERVSLDTSKNVHKSGSNVAQNRGGCSSLSEAAFYLSLGESDGAEVSASKDHKVTGLAASANLNIDENFDEVDGALAL